MKLADTLNSKDNNFNLLRLSAATFVLIHHMHVFLGESGRVHWIAGEVMGSAVQIFIIISGFLVTKSWMNDPRPFLFVKKRALRIFPALACSVLLAVLIIGPLVTRADLKLYFSHPGTTEYLKNVFLFPVYYYLPGVFMNNPYPHAVNGSLWSLPIEVFLYGLLIILGLTRVVGKRVLVAGIAVLLIAGEQYFKPALSASRVFFLTMPVSFLLSLGIFFFIGALYYLYAEKIVLNKWAALLLLPLFVVANKLPLSELIRYAVLPYIVLYVAYSDIAFIKFFQKMDVSYGVYVYAFPIQQTVVHYYYGQLGTYTILMMSLAIVLAVSYLSWRFVEKPSLAWAHRRSADGGGGTPAGVRHDGAPTDKSARKSGKKRSKRKGRTT
ncbi:MAG: acyltransferase [Nitrospirota bacterium]